MNSICLRNADRHAKRILIKISSQLGLKHTSMNPTAWDQRYLLAEVLHELVSSSPMQTQEHGSHPADWRAQDSPISLQPQVRLYVGPVSDACFLLSYPPFCLLQKIDHLQAPLSNLPQEAQLYLKWHLPLQQPRTPRASQIPPLPLWAPVNCLLGGYGVSLLFRRVRSLWGSPGPCPCTV